MTETDLQRLQAGDDAVLEKLYTDNYGYVTGVLVYKYQAGLAEAQDVYADSVLRFREQVQKGGLTFGNLRAYLTRIAVNLCLEQRRGIQSELNHIRGHLL